MMQLVLLLLITVVAVSGEDDVNLLVSSNPQVSYLPCNGSDDIRLIYEFGITPEAGNDYSVYVNKQFTLSNLIIMKFDSATRIKLHDKNFARVSAGYNNTFYIRFFQPHDGVSFTVDGLIPGIISYMTSFQINNKEYCSEPLLGGLDSYVKGYQDTAESGFLNPDEYCGRRKVTHTELIVNGAPTKAGDWPWHVALYRIEGSVIKYICGGTLISKTYVLTAAHCVTLRGVPVLTESLSVVLGKFNLIGGDTDLQEREVFSIIVHDQYNHRKLENDIALLKLKSEAVFTDYVQPACIWYPTAIDSLPYKEIFGTVVGWGFEHTDTLAPQIRQAKLPMVSESTCIKSNPLFYSKFLQNNRKFCAGYRNGTSACNGDSGSAFQVFIPDTPRDKDPNALGAWYVRGIVSVTLARADTAICNPDQYVVFTDVEKYTFWIENHNIH